jgi:3-oxoacyl-[acyl-carrier-protein] synthase II
MQTALPSYLAHCVPHDVLQTALPERRPTFNRMVVPKTMPNSSAVWVSICLGLSGSCHTVNASCASGTYAIGEAFRRIKDGYEKILLTGGVECFQDQDGFMMRGFDVLGVLTQSPDGRPHPFGRDRSGFLFAEGGACLLVLEELQHAWQRHAPIYAEITDFRANSDAFSPVQLESEGKQITRLLGELSAGRKIDYLNAHGTGTLANDQVEAKAIQSVFGDHARQPWINSTKGILGHTLGASGAIEAAVTALSVARGSIHPNLTENPMPELNLPLDPVEGPLENALSVSYGFGGHNGGLLLSRFETSPPSK